VRRALQQTCSEDFRRDGKAILMIDHIRQRDKLMAPDEAEAMPIRRVEKEDHTKPVGRAARNDLAELLEHGRRPQTAGDPDPDTCPSLRQPRRPEIQRRAVQVRHRVFSERAVEPGDDPRSCCRHVQRIDPAAGARLFVVPGRVAEVPMMAGDRVGYDGRRGIVQIVFGNDGHRAAALHEQSGILQRLAGSAHVRQRHGRNPCVAGSGDGCEQPSGGEINPRRAAGHRPGSPSAAGTSRRSSAR